MKLVLPCHLIPDRTVVTKPTGTKPYILRDNFPLYFYGEKKEEIKIEVPQGLKYLVAQNDNSDVSIIANLDQELAVHFDTQEDMFDFVDILRWKEEEENSK